MNYVVPLWPQPALPVVNTPSLFPVRRIYCVGRNYAAHAREMGHDPNRELPFFFMKPADALVQSGGRVPYPPATSDVHHEVELVVAIGAPARAIDPAEAAAAVFGYAVGIDLTRRDLQAEAKAKARPWDMSKGFDHSAPCSAIRPAASGSCLAAGGIQLLVNGNKRQSADIADMIWSVPEILSHLSRLVSLLPGDLVFTGTPEGVATVNRGDNLHATVEGIGTLDVQII